LYQTAMTLFKRVFLEKRFLLLWENYAYSGSMDKLRVSLYNFQRVQVPIAARKSPYATFLLNHTGVIIEQRRSCFKVEIPCYKSVFILLENL
jgi:hypothetical protein